MTEVTVEGVTYRRGETLVCPNCIKNMKGTVDKSYNDLVTELGNSHHERKRLIAQLDAVTRERDALKAKLERLRPGVLYCYNTDGKNLEFFNAVKEVYGQEVTETRVEVPRE